MRRISLAAVVGGFAAVVVTSSAAHTQEPAQPTVGVATYYKCDITQQARADTLVKEVIGPIYDKYLSEGKLVSWGWAAHVIGGEWRRLAFFYAKDQATLVSVRQELVAEVAQNHPAELQELNTICYTHEDYVWRTIIARP